MEAPAPDRRLAQRYVLEDEIAAGGMARLWRAFDEVLARTVAIKILRDDLAEDPEFLARFQAEAVAAARLTHPFIISVFDTGMDYGVSFIVMEYFEGQTLRQIMDRRRAMDPAEAVAAILPVLSALVFAHSMGIVHRDIKPENILVASDGRVKVTDFGIAKAAFAAHDLTTTGSVLGTVRYLSPEQVQGTRIDARSDLYSVGVVLYELLTGRPPFQAETDVATAMMRLTADPLAPGALRPGIPRGLAAAVMRSLARQPEDRYSSAQAMHTTLQRFAQQGEPTASQGFIRLPATRAGRRTASVKRRGTFGSWMLIPLLVIVVVGAGVGGGLALGRLRLGGPLGIRAATQSPAAASGSPTSLHIAGAKDFDPRGDQSEHPEAVPLAIDGNPATAWTTDHYNSPTFGNLKPGLGLWVDLGGTNRVARVTVSSTIPGWTFQLESGTLQHLSIPLPSTGGATTFTIDATGQAVIDLRPVQASGILIWITRLAPDAGRFAATISEVKVFGAAP
jgi:serine/threonine-protein kinase